MTVCSLILSAGQVRAEEDFSKNGESSVTISGLTAEQAGTISRSCASLKQSLKQLQKTDTSTRSYLGSIYETLLSGFIAPLNLRLTKNNQPSATISDLHSSLISKRQDFSQKFITYSQDFEELLNVDCKSDPEKFYDQLLKTRKSRSALEKTVTEMRNLLDKQLTAVEKLEAKYEN